jgi:release factor glutamine methyltransferase
VNLGRLLALVRYLLERHHVPDASLEAELLARHVLGLDRAELHARPERPVSPEELAAVKALAERRARGEPSAYITGHRWFYKLDFHVGDGVLIPRPETELLVDLALAAIRESRGRAAADIGTGSGVIAVSLAHEVRDLTVVATDVSEKALAIARQNAERYGVADRIIFRQGDLLEPLTGPVDIICANLPYVKETELSAGGPLSCEPQLALDGGPDGLDVFRRFFPQVGSRLCPGGRLFLEIGAGQAPALLALLERDLPPGRFTVHRDLARHERVIEFRLTA